MMGNSDEVEDNQADGSMVQIVQNSRQNDTYQPIKFFTSFEGWGISQHSHTNRKLN